MKQKDVDYFRQQIEEFVRVDAPPSHNGLSWSMIETSINFDIRWKEFGWGQMITLAFQEEACIINWSSTERSIVNALAFLSKANNIVGFAARLETYAKHLLKSCNK